MTHLPLYIEKKLKTLFPKETDRQDFVKQVIIDALAAIEAAKVEKTQLEQQIQVGGIIHVYSDGGSRGNPGQAAIGCVLYDAATKKVIQEYKESIGVETNNIAEYKALIKGLELAAAFHPNQVVCHLDSELVVKQVKGEYKVKMPHLVPLIAEVQNYIKQMPMTIFTYIPRSQNQAADALVNQALDSISSKHVYRS